MTSRTAWIAGVLGIALASEGRAQVPTIPIPSGGVGSAASSASAVSALGAGVAPAAASPRTLWGFLGLSKSNLAACKNALCQTQLGLMLNNAAGPASKFSAGLIPPLCPQALSPAVIAGLPGGPQGAEATAAKIKASEADAKARVAAVDYLGTVDCTHWPEATKALKNALRLDPNECVRFAAARALSRGCCCSKEMIDALKVTVAATDTDGNPPETSSRVKSVAFSALQNCLTKVPDALPPEPIPAPPEPLRPETGPAPRPAPTVKPERSTGTLPPAIDDASRPASYESTRPSSYEQSLRHKTFAQTVDEARRTMQQVAATAPPSTTLPPGRRSVYHALVKARQDVSGRPTVRTPATAAPSALVAPVDAGVSPSSYTPTPAPAAAPTGPKGQARDASTDANPSPSARRGLLGMMFRSQVRTVGQ